MINPKKELAENIDLSTYETTPIESYGLKMLQKMSSNNNTNINRKRKAPEVIEYKPRNHRSGLGFEMDRTKIKIKEDWNKSGGYKVIPWWKWCIDHINASLCK